MIATAVYRIEVDLSRIAEGDRADAGRALVRAMLDARGGAFAMPGAFEDARLVGDTLYLALAMPDELAREALYAADKNTVCNLADEYGAHEDCRSEDDVIERVTEAQSEAESRAEDAFEKIIDRLLEQDAATPLRDVLDKIKEKINSGGPNGSVRDAFTVLGMPWPYKAW